MSLSIAVNAVNAGLKIGQLAQRTGTQVETIRHYERVGLLPKPMRSEGNYRLYDSMHVERLTFIRRCRALGMTQQEIRILLQLRDIPNQDCAEVNALLDRHIALVIEHAAELQRLEKQLKDLRRLCRKSRRAGDCRILRELAKPASPRQRSGTKAPT